MKHINLPLRYKAILKILYRLLRGEKYLTYSFFQNSQKSFQNPEFYLQKRSEKLSIIVQGPYLKKENFTLDTLRSYRKNFPDSIIILSTWSVPKCDDFLLKEIDVKIILNAKPTYSGSSNVNLQIVSTKSGILLAKKLGAFYALKTRTDQRICNPYLYTYLTNLLSAFPLLDKNYPQHSRLIACSLNTFKLRMYCISDMFLFGYIDDMVRYWSVPMDNRTPGKVERDITWRQLSKRKESESYFCIKYLQSIGKELEFTLKSSLSTIAKHFIVIDQHAIGLFWNKYTYDENRYLHGFYNSQLTFNDWLILHSDLDNVAFEETMLDFKINRNK
jgi:hypothetical protein